MPEHPNIRFIRRLRIIKREVDQLIKDMVNDLEREIEKPQPPARLRMCTIPDGFSPRRQDIEWAQSSYPEVDHAQETEKFRDYWLGTGGRKQNWDATWRNWIRQSARYLERDQARPRLSVHPTVGEANRTKADRVAARFAARVEQSNREEDDPFQVEPELD